MAAPSIELNFLADPDDRRRLREVTRWAWRIACSEAVRRATDGVIALDEGVVADDDRLDGYLRAHIGTYCHALGTAAMGPRDDGRAVVDPQCRVHGLNGLWVVDASVMPAVPRVVPNLSVIAMAERMAEHLAIAVPGCGNHH